MRWGQRRHALGRDWPAAYSFSTDPIVCSFFAERCMVQPARLWRRDDSGLKIGRNQRLLTTSRLGISGYRDRLGSRSS